jgi:Spy/CpxP family protein refolding chaperone
MKSKLQVRILCAAMLLFGAAIVASSASAQDTPPPPMPERPQGAPQGPGGPGRGMMDPDRRAQMLKDRLGLSDSQAAQVKAVYEDERARSQALMADQTGDRDAMRARMGEIRKGSDERIAAILNPDQKAKWDAMRAEMQQRGRGPGGPPPGSPPPPQTPPQL